MRIIFTGARRGELVEIGRIVKPQGVKGELKVLPLAGAPLDFSGLEELFLLPASGGPPLAYPLLAVRSQGGALVIRLAGVDDRNQAEALRDRVVALAAGELPPLAPDDIYWHQLAGLAAYTAEGRKVGLVTDFMLTAAHPLLVIVDEQHREYLVPVHPEFMALRHDHEGESAWLLLTPPPGLLGEG
ncbi:ribosome maturation factor RimM [Desulfurivibrio alkaliphilus]|uniref:Ribosome maturation factor RimM n=1 Tax=Desulfurivibrio alkaliphilus (strain DSM 19089 / UNIQEM U267 / AHT2) TaxID=589865 RepID=D6Z2U4_DESAT|nr:ribosome maturation factor RimM [Desulfurivibrio alkaliphilus]ADH85869.1 16S rRNA processing protein RimM [Desulfurivibrio alkaliphilus AHT 2]